MIGALHDRQAKKVVHALTALNLLERNQEHHWVMYLVNSYLILRMIIYTVTTDSRFLNVACVVHRVHLMHTGIMFVYEFSFCVIPILTHLG